MTKEDMSRVQLLVGNVLPKTAAVVREIDEGNSLVLHGEICSIFISTGNGNLINTRCVGARALGGGRVFVAWRESEVNPLEIVEYTGESIFPEYSEPF